MDIVLNDNFWDCECEHDYIRFKTTDRCKICKVKKEDQPSSRQLELDEKYGPDCTCVWDDDLFAIFYDNMNKKFWVSEDGDDIDLNFDTYELADYYVKQQYKS